MKNKEEISMVKLVGQLLLNSLRFRYLKRTGKAGKPQAISIEITHNCIAKCIMCNIWKIPPDVPNLPADRWASFLSTEIFSDLRELDVTGGEPFLRKDLFDFLKEIAVLKRNHLKRLRTVIITTNGFLTQNILNLLEKVLPLYDRSLLSHKRG